MRVCQSGAQHAPSPQENYAGAVASWMGHVLGLDEGVEFFGGDVAEIKGGFAEADVGLMSGFGDLGGLVVADFGSEGGDEHQRILDVVIDLLAIGFDAVDAVFDKTVAGI